MRFAYMTGILNLSNFRMLRELITSLGYVGITRPRFERMYNVIDLVWNNTTTNQMAGDGDLVAAASQNDIQALRTQEFNALAVQDMLLFKMSLESATAGNVFPEYGDLMLEITGRMAGMTPGLLLEILGRSTLPPPILKVQKTALLAATVPTLSAFELAAWSYIHREPGFRYTPIPGLVDQLATPIFIPASDRLAEPYRSMALLMSDLAVVSNLRQKEQLAADDYSIAHPLDPPGWYPLATVHQILENDRQRLAQVRQHITGASPEARDALIYLINIRMTEF